MPIYALGDDEPYVDATAYVSPDAVVIGAVVIGAAASIWPCAVLRGDYAPIRVGARTSVQDGTVVHTARKLPTTIGADCVVGHNAHLEGCVVEDECLLGSGSVTLNGVHVGAGSIIGAGALVPEGVDVPAKSLAVGVPARMRPLARDTGFVQSSVQTYIDNAGRYQRELKRID